MTESYWQRTLRGRVSRRRALGGAAGIGVGAAALSLVGCSGDDNVTSDIEVSGGLATPKDTSEIAKAGGVYRDVATADVQTFDVGETSNFTAYAAANLIYSRIVKSKSIPTQPVGAEIDGDLAESWEVTNDGTQWTFRFRPNIKMHPVAPLNGRAMDIEDVRLSWERFAAGNPRRNRYNMIDSVSTPDDRTMVFKLKFPYGPFGKILADTSAFWVMPKEAATGQVDYRATGAGTGPYILEEHRPSAFINYRKHPEYFLQGLPYIERREYPIVTEYAQRLAQFKAGNIYNITPNNADIINTRGDVPNALIYQPDFTVGWPVIFFGRTDPIFHGVNGDVRIRRALSMAIDRDLYIDTFYQINELEAAGFANIEKRWHNMISCGWPYWLDPQSSEQGPSGQWYKYDVAEAKRLLAAAGYPNGIDMDVHYATIFLAGARFRAEVEATIGFWQEAGFNVRQVGEDFQQEFLPKTVEKGDMTGISISPSGEYNEVDTLLVSQWTIVPGAPNDRNPPAYNDPQLNALIEKQRRTLDEEERTQTLHEIQRFLSDRLWGIPWGGQATSSFQFYWPWVQNVQVFRGSPDSFVRSWLDQTKMST